MNKNALLIIDPQNDFCNLGSKASQKGSLYVEGASDDMQRLSRWIEIHKKNIDFMAITLDSHQPNDISHPSFWIDENKKHPMPFTQISFEEAKSGKWIARFEPQKALQYLKDIEEQGEFAHTIWPMHCVSGSFGFAIYEPLMESIKKWALEGNFYQIIEKGKYPFTEHFGAFKAQVSDSKHPETQLNIALLKKLDSYKNIYLAGEAKSHCVANSLKQVMEFSQELARKFIVLEDAMSNVTGFETIAKPIFQKAQDLGVRFSSTKSELF